MEGESDQEQRLNGMFKEYFSSADVHGLHLNMVPFPRWETPQSLTHSSQSAWGLLACCRETLIAGGFVRFKSRLRKEHGCQVHTNRYVETVLTGYRASSSAGYMCVLGTGANKMGINQE